MTFKKFIENLWGDIPVVGRKPSDGPGGLATNPSSPGGQAAPTAGPAPNAGPPPKMMRKKMRKR